MTSVGLGHVTSVGLGRVTSCMLVAEAEHACLCWSKEAADILEVWRLIPGAARKGPRHSGGLLWSPRRIGRGCFPPLESDDWEEPFDLEEQ